MKVQDLFSIAKQSFQEWSEDRAPNEAASLAYYALLAVPALLLLIQWIVGQVVSDQVQEQVISLVVESVRGQGRDAIATLIENADRPGSGGGFATLVSLVTLAVSASGIVVQLEQALNRMWEVTTEDGGVIVKIQKRVSSMVMVLLLGLFLLLSVSLSTIVSGFAETLTGYLSLGEWILQGINVAFSLVLLILLFGTILKTVPDAKVAWRDVWLGAIVTSVLFIIGQYALSFYLGKSAPGSAYGAAGSIVAFVVWVYYSALILFLGAEFTQVYANRFGSRIRPDEAGIPLEDKIVRGQTAPSHEPAPDMADAAVGKGERPSSERPAARPLADGHTAAALTTRSRKEVEEDYFQYYTVAFLALALGLWRLLRGGKE